MATITQELKRLSDITKTYQTTLLTRAKLKLSNHCQPLILNTIHLELEEAERDRLQRELRIYYQCIVVLAVAEQQGVGVQDERVWSFLTGCACRRSSSIPQCRRQSLLLQLEWLRRRSQQQHQLRDVQLNLFLCVHVWVCVYTVYINLGEGSAFQNSENILNCKDRIDHWFLPAYHSHERTVLGKGLNWRPAILKLLNSLLDMYCSHLSALPKPLSFSTSLLWLTVPIATNNTIVSVHPVQPGCCSVHSCSIMKIRSMCMQEMTPAKWVWGWEGVQLLVS